MRMVVHFWSPPPKVYIQLILNCKKKFIYSLNINILQHNFSNIPNEYLSKMICVKQNLRKKITVI